MDDILNTVLDIDPAATRHPIAQAADILDAEVVDSVPDNRALAVPVEPKPERDIHAEELDDDIDHVREQIKQIIDDGRSALNGIMELAAAGDEPRAYEVIAELMTATVNANRELINIHEVRKKAKKADAEAAAAKAKAGIGVSSLSPTSGAPIQIDKAVFFGRASDLLRELQAVKKQTTAALNGKA
jgi:hypothetical protein